MKQTSSNLATAIPGQQHGDGAMPLVWVPLDNRTLGSANKASPWQVLSNKYATALRQGAGCQPVCFPLIEVGEIADLLAQAQIDGIMLTGSASNIEAHHYGEHTSGEHTSGPVPPGDRLRDSQSFALTRKAIALGIPLFGICRGMQEMNVALGGSLYQQVHMQPGMRDHREDSTLPYAGQYGLAHPVCFAAGSRLIEWADGTQAQVNSLHGQGIARLANDLQAEAWAEDGLIEAVQVRNAPTFMYGVQWHPEYNCTDYSFYLRTFHAFGRAVHQHRQMRCNPPRNKRGTTRAKACGAAPARQQNLSTSRD